MQIPVNLVTEPKAERVTSYPLAIRSDEYIPARAKKVGQSVRSPAKEKVKEKVKAKSNARSFLVLDLLLETLLPLVAIVWSLVLWGYSIVDIDPRTMGPLGLVSAFSLASYLGIVLLTISFAMTLHRGRSSTWLLWAHVATFIFMIHGAPPLIYDTLRYSWAWKHLGVVDYIQRLGQVDPNASVLSAYHNWPGFFTFFAYLFEVAGIKNVVGFASWAPVFFNLLTTGALVLIFKASTNDRRLIWQGVWFYFLANWVGQDYFAPQTLNYFLHLVIIGVCLAWFRSEIQPGEQINRRWRFVQPLFDFLYDLRQRAAASDAQELKPPPVQRVALLLLVITLFVVIVTSHQLTPIMTILAVSALVLFQRCRATSLPLLMIVIASIWIVYGAIYFVQGNLFSLFKTFGSVTSNVEANLIDLSQTSSAQQVVALAGRGLTIAVLVLSLLGCIQRIRRNKWDLSLMLLAFAPFLMLSANGYGGEVVFRVYLFAMPFLAFFMAALLYPTIDKGNSRWMIVVNVVLSLLIFTGFNFAYFGKDRIYFFSRDEENAARYLYQVAPPNSLLIEGSPNYPSKFQNYEYFTYVPISREHKDTQKRVLADPVGVLSRWMSNQDFAKSYLIITESQKQEVDLLPDRMAPGSLDKIEQSLLTSPNFKVIYENEDARIFEWVSNSEGIK